MLNQPGLEPIDYLLIGHLSKDLTPEGHTLGGAVAYAALTAQAFGFRVGIVTSYGNDISTEVLENITILNLGVENSTSFENINEKGKRSQILHHQAEILDFHHVPELWRSAPIVHLAPIAQEINPTIIKHFTNSKIYVTPQGWLRQWDHKGRVFSVDWPELDYLLPVTNAVVISEEDVRYDESRINAFALAAPILVVTRGELGASIYQNGSEYNLPGVVTEVMDSTGAGDIFATTFFINLTQNGDPIKSAHYANQIAAKSVSRFGLNSVPNLEDLYETNLEVI